MKKIILSLVLSAVALSASAALKLFYTISKTVTTAGTPVSLSATNIFCTAIYVQNRATNSGNIYVQTHASAGEPRVVLTPGQGFPVTVNIPGDFINATNIHIDATVSGESADAFFLIR